MLLNEIINEVGMTKRAVKYYEEKGLLSVDKDSNGYRNYSAQDVETLKKISVYRKLGIGIKDMFDKPLIHSCSDKAELDLIRHLLCHCRHFTRHLICHSVLSH